jgi:hypothetical protein
MPAAKPPSRGARTENGIECTPDALFSGVAGCVGFLMTLLSVASLSVIAAGVFWTAQQMDKITDDTHSLLLQLQGTYKPA